jgi:hypothetical protein
MSRYELDGIMMQKCSRCVSRTRSTDFARMTLERGDSHCSLATIFSQSRDLKIRCCIVHVLVINYDTRCYGSSEKTRHLEDVSGSSISFVHHWCFSW